MSSRSSGKVPAATRWAALLFLSAPIAACLAFLTSLGWAAPLLGGLAAWLWLKRNAERSVTRCVLFLLGWAALLSLTTILLSFLLPEQAAHVIPRGSAYWQEMIEFVRTGGGTEGTPALFIPEHLLHLGIFLLLALVTGGLLALVLGAFLIGYMSYYVAQVALHAEEPVLAVLLAWHPWALLRVVAFLILGVCFARPLLLRRDPRVALSETKGPLLLASVLWLGDLLLKAALAPVWSALIRSWAGVSVP